MSGEKTGAGLTRRAFASLLFAVPVLASEQALAAPKTLHRNVIYRERMRLPPGAIVEVKLVDVSLADAPSRTIAETRIPARGGSPIAYTLRFDSKDIRPRHTYALQARILDRDRLLFINTTRHPVFEGRRDNTEIRVERVSGREEPVGLTIAGRWLAEDIRGGGVIDRLQSVLEIGADGQVSGSGGCNRMSGRATIDGSNIRFGRLASTNMACVPAAMDQEHKFFSAIEETRSFRIDQRRRKLFLINARGRTVMQLSAM